MIIYFFFLLIRQWLLFPFFSHIIYIDIMCDMSSIRKTATWQTYPPESIFILLAQNRYLKFSEISLSTPQITIRLIYNALVNPGRFCFRPFLPVSLFSRQRWPGSFRFGLPLGRSDAPVTHPCGWISQTTSPSHCQDLSLM